MRKKNIETTAALPYFGGAVFLGGIVEVLAGG
jgi:hypothetical protein